MRQDHDFFCVNIKEPTQKKAQVSTETTEEDNWGGNEDEETGVHWSFLITKEIYLVPIT